MEGAVGSCVVLQQAAQAPRRWIESRQMVRAHCVCASSHVDGEVVHGTFAHRRHCGLVGCNHIPLASQSNERMLWRRLTGGEIRSLRLPRGSSQCSISSQNARTKRGRASGSMRHRAEWDDHVPVISETLKFAALTLGCRMEAYNGQPAGGSQALVLPMMARSSRATRIASEFLWFVC